MTGMYTIRNCPNCNIRLMNCSTNLERVYKCGLCDYEERPTK